MKVAVDIDDVLIDFRRSLLKVFEKEFGREFHFEEFTSSSPWECFDIREEDVREIIRRMGDDVPVVEGAKEGLEFLNSNHELVSITARRKSIRERSERLLEKNFGIPIKVWCGNDFWKGNGEKSKLDICKELGVDILIDDSEDFSEEVAKAGIKVFLFDKPWNQGIKHENICRVKNWNEVVEHLDGN